MTTPLGDADRAEAVRRWRLVLGRYADRDLGPVLGPDRAVDESLGFLFDREYRRRGHQHGRSADAGGTEPSALDPVSWLERIREFFPESTYERLQAQALQNYGMSDILADDATVAALPASPELAAALLRIRGSLDSSTEAGIRTIIDRVVEQIVARLRPSFSAAVAGRRDRTRHSAHRIRQNFAWKRTIEANFAVRDAEGRMILRTLHFDSRVRRSLPWDVVLCVDQSASMASSVLHGAVSAAILAALPGVNCRLILFDTAVVDMTDHQHDPVSVLMTAQLGGGTDIAGALAYCQTLITRPSRTVLVLISDFVEGGSVTQLLHTVSRLAESGVTLLGLAALDENAHPVHDVGIGEQLAARGMEIAALTPDHFAHWLGEVMR